MPALTYNCFIAFSDNKCYHVIILKSICFEFGPGSYVVNFGFIYGLCMWLRNMLGTSTWKMLTFSWLKLISSTYSTIDIKVLFNKESNGI